MFYKLITRNSARSRKENGLFFASLLVSIIAFYIILALPRQDVMIFLDKMESQAVDRLFQMIPLFFGMTLLILFFLVYYAGQFQLERRRHEFGVYLMMGMRRPKLFLLLLAEDFRSSLLSLAVGLPAAVLLSELISLATARIVGMGIVGHRFTLSPTAVLWTVLGFLAIKLGAFLLLSGRIAGQELGALLSEAPKGARRRLAAPIYVISFILGLFFLAAAYAMAIRGLSWYNLKKMGTTLLLGFSGTMLLFLGLGSAIGFLVNHTGRNRRLHTFTFRQIQENIVLRSGSLAVSSLLLLAALCCLGAGAAVSGYFNRDSNVFSLFGKTDSHILDYTFPEYQEGAETLKQIESNDLDACFSQLFEINLGHIRTGDGQQGDFTMESVLEALEQAEASQDRDVLLNNLGYAVHPYLISLSGYNHLLSLAEQPALTLAENEAAVYMNHEDSTPGRLELMNEILEKRPAVTLDRETFYLTGTVQTLNLVTDRAISLSFALIVPDQVFTRYTQGDYSTYLNAVLDPELLRSRSLMSAIMEINERLDEAGLEYESYLQNMGRKLFYAVAAGYLTLYLTVIFLIIANTVMGVQFLMSQQKSGRRYKTLIRLGASYELLCRCAGKQLNWYFGLPIAVAVISSLFGIRSLLTGILGYLTTATAIELMGVSATMIFLLVVVESVYIAAARRSACRYLLTLMTPEREE